MKILFVCTGNTCRSPMCEGFFRALCAHAGKDRIQCASAGVATRDGLTASPNARAVLRKNGIDPDSHRSRLLTKEIVRDSDMIVALTSAHREKILEKFPESAKKVRILGEFSDPENPKDVEDPFGGTPDVYEACFHEMKAHLQKLFEKI